MSILQKVKTQEKIDFTNSLAVMLQSGLAVNEALHTLAQQTKTKAFKNILIDVQQRIQAGTSLSESFSRHEEIFGKVFLSLLKIGESSGTLSESLDFLSDWLERDHTLRQEINAATTYPKFVFGATILMGAGLALYILPKLIPLFGQLNVKLPLPTVILLWVTAFVQDYWYVMALIVVLMILFYKLLMRMTPTRRMIHAFVLKVPIMGPMIYSYQLALVMRLLHTLLRSGVSIRETLTITSEAATNMSYQESLEHINKRVAAGTPLSTGMQDYPHLYPLNVISIVATGERSGNLSKSLDYLADHYLKIVRMRAKRLPTVLEPVLLIFIGLVVGFVAFSIIMPIYSLTSGSVV